MNRRSTTLLAALEALVVVGIGIGIPLSLLTVMWAASFGFQLDWIVFWRAAVDIWAIGHGADVTFTIDPETAASAGVPLATEPFRVSLALLGFAALTLAAGWQMGHRTRGERHRVLGGLIAIGGILVLGGLAALSAGHPAALLSRWQTALHPAIIFSLGFAVATLSEPDRGSGSGSARWSALGERLPALPRAIGAVAVRAGAGTVVSVVGVAALVTSAALIVGYGDVIALYESVQVDLLGCIILTMGQLALLPTVVLWTASWLLGPGFAIGAGSSISPLGTAVGPLPAVPLLGALPSTEFAPGFIVLLVPVLSAFVAGIAVRPRLLAALTPGAPWIRWAVVTAGATAACAAVLAVLLAVISSGSAGPGRLADVGPDPIALGVWMLVEAFVGALLGLLAGGVRPSRLR
jgi:hypothetical protein